MSSNAASAMRRTTTVAAGWVSIRAEDEAAHTDSLACRGSSVRPQPTRTSVASRIAITLSSSSDPDMVVRVLMRASLMQVTQPDNLELASIAFA